MGCYTITGFKRTVAGLAEILHDPGFVSATMGGLLPLLTGAIPVLCVYAIVSIAHINIVAAALIPLAAVAFIAYLRLTAKDMFG